MQCHFLPKKQKSSLYFVRPTPYITQSCIGVSLEFFMRLWSKDNYSYNIKLSLQLFIVSPFPLALDLVKFLVAQDAVR